MTNRNLDQCSDEELIIELGGGGPSLSSQHSGGRGQQISEFKVSLIYKVSSRTARATEKDKKTN